MKRQLSVLAVVVLLGLAAAVPAAAKGKGLTQADVEARGWACFPSEVMTHCVRPGTDIDALVAGTLASVPSLNFLDGRFIGTEILVRADLGADDRPCSQGTEPDGTYEAVDFSGDGEPEYYSCHHNNEG